MKRLIALIPAMLLLLSACATAAPAIVPTSTHPQTTTVPASLTQIPTNTVTPTAAPSAIPSATASATPEPLSGSLVVVAGREVRRMAADGSGSRVLLSREQFEAQFPARGDAKTVPYWSSLLSPDGKSILVFTCAQYRYNCGNKRLYASRLDLSLTTVLQTFAGGLLLWAPTSDKFMMQYATNVRNKVVVSAADKASSGKFNNLPASSAAFWSFDGKQIYYFDNKAWSVVDSDGSRKKTLKCVLCASAPDPSSYAVAQSPNGAQIAIGYLDGTIIIANSELTAYKIGKVGGYVNKLLWAPDGTRLAVDVRSSTNQSDVVILDASGALLDSLPRPEAARFMNACAWSPDSKNLAYLTLGDSGNELYLQPLGQPEPVHFLSLESEIGTCPVWLEGEP